MLLMCDAYLSSESTPILCSFSGGRNQPLFPQLSMSPLSSYLWLGRTLSSKQSFVKQNLSLLLGDESLHRFTGGESIAMASFLLNAHQSIQIFPRRGLLLKYHINHDLAVLYSAIPYATRSFHPHQCQTLLLIAVPYHL